MTDHKLTPGEWVAANEAWFDDPVPGKVLAVPSCAVERELERLTKECDEARAEFHASNEQHCRHIATLENRAEKAEKERDEWKANAEAAEEECERRRDRAKSAERERDAHRQAAEKAERAAAAMRHALEHFKTASGETFWIELAVKVDAALAFDAGRDFVSRTELEKAERAAAAMREALIAQRDGRFDDLPIDEAADKHDALAVAALASDAGREFLSRDEVFEMLLRFGPEAPSAQEVDAIIDEVIKERDRG